MRQFFLGNKHFILLAYKVTYFNLIKNIITPCLVIILDNALQAHQFKSLIHPFFEKSEATNSARVL